MAHKYKQKKIKGVRITEKIEGKAERPSFPRPAIFKNAKAYERKKLRRELRDEK